MLNAECVLLVDHRHEEEESLCSMCVLNAILERLKIQDLNYVMMSLIILKYPILEFGDFL